MGVHLVLQGLYYFLRLREDSFFKVVFPLSQVMQQLMQECSPEPKFKIACSCIHSVLITVLCKNRVENKFQAFSWLLTSRQTVFAAYLGSQLVSRFQATLVPW